MMIERQGKIGSSEEEREDNRGKHGRGNGEERQDAQRGSSGHADTTGAGTEGRLVGGGGSAALVATTVP